MTPNAAVMEGRRERERSQLTTSLKSVADAHMEHAKAC